MAFEFIVELKDEVSEAAGGMADSVGGLSKALGGGGGLTSVLDGVAPGLGEAAKGVLGVASAMGAVVVAGSKMAISAVQSKDALIAKFGAPTLAMFDDLGEKVGKTRDALGLMADKFKAMGITDVPALRQALLAASSASALIAGGGDAYATLARKIQEATQAGVGLKLADRQLASLAATGANVDDIAKKMGKSTAQLRAELKAGTINAAAFGDALQQALIEKGAGPLGALAGNLTTLGAQLEENVTKLFEDAGPGVDEFMSALRDLFSVFSQTTSSGQALKGGLSGLFSTILSAAAKVLPYIKFGLQQLIIWGLKLYITLKPHFDTIKTVLKGVAIVVGVLMAVAVAAAAVVALPFILMAAAGMALYAAIGYVIGKFGDWYDAVVGFVSGAAKALTEWIAGAQDTARAFVDGLVSGIINAIPNLIAAVGNLAQAAKDKVKSMLGISSPSKVMATMGKHTGAGLAEGIRGSSAAVADATSDLASAATSAPALSAAATPGPYSSPQGGGSTITVDVGGIHLEGGTRGALELTEEAVVTIFERVALARGL